MKLSISYEIQIKQLLTHIIASNELHAKWLNTLSFLENCGARKIAACEHPTLVKEEMLKHAAEEFRHAHHLKRQIERVSQELMENYSQIYLLGDISTLHYLLKLDLKTSRFLKEQGLSKTAIKEIAYLLVTYAIELRAEEFYSIYDDVLRKTRSRVTIKSILLEEKEHLNEMKESLESIPNGMEYAKIICKIENDIFNSWLNNIAKSLKV